jgi:bla regulator protein BlaR1
MTAYLIKSILCSALFLLVYKLLFEKEKMFRFNRIFLLSGLILAFVVPLLTIPVHSSALPGVNSVVLNAEVINKGAYASAPDSYFKSIIQHDYWLMSYLLVAAVILFRFTFNLKKLYSKISNNLRVVNSNATIVLDESIIVPYSFLSFIFINKHEYEQGIIEDEILIHEMAHVLQRHSLDVLFIELLQVITWFNPVLYFYRKAIELNHEFLADDSVIQACNNTAAYQYLLINKMSHQKTSILASQFNYLITKKRFIMMTKITSQIKAVFKQLVIVPLLFLATLIFGTKTIAQQTSTIEQSKQKEVPSTQDGISKEELLEYEQIVNKTKNEKGIKRWNMLQADQSRLEKIYLSMSKEQQEKQIVRFIPAPPPLPRLTPTNEQIIKWKNSKVYGVWIDDKRVSNTVLSNFTNKDFASYFASKLAKNAVNYGKHYVQINIMTNAYYDAYYKKAIANKRNYMEIRVKEGNYLL